MDRKEIERKVKEILAERLDIDIRKIKLDSDLVNDLGMDSFGAVEVAFEIKEKLGIEITEENFNKIKKVEDITDYILKILEGERSEK